MGKKNSKTLTLQENDDTNKLVLSLEEIEQKERVVYNRLISLQINEDAFLGVSVALFFLIACVFLYLVLPY